MFKKILGLFLIYALLAVLLLPLLVTALMGGFDTAHMEQAKALYSLEDYFQAQPTTEQTEQAEQAELNELESYVMGVVSAEMPALFPMEALKAQAVAARTYQIRKMEENGSDTVLYDIGQAYADTQAQKEKWGAQYAEYAARIRQAVTETQGEIMVYEGEPILAVFHAQSAGKTEDSENVWVQTVPYLRSVDSSGDHNAPDNTATVTLSAQTVWEALSQYGDLGVSADALTFGTPQRSAAGYILAIPVGNLTLEGSQIRTALGLRSTDFTVSREGDTFTFVTKGYGHGAGMSQYGAKSLADEGYNYHEILSRYYTGISFEKIA